MTKYTYSITTHLGGNVNLSQLHQEIKTNPYIDPNLIGVNKNNDNITIEFDSILTGAEENILNSVVASHDPQEIIEMTNSLTANPRDNSIKTDYYKRLCSFLFPGSTHASFKTHSYKNTTLTSYSIKIYDVTNRKLILEKTLNNIDEIPIELGLGNNIPSTNSILEVSCKKTGHGTAYLESITLSYP